MTDTTNRIAFLEETHSMLERELDKATHQDTTDEVLNTLKKRKLMVKDLIAELKDKQGREFV